MTGLTARRRMQSSAALPLPPNVTQQGGEVVRECRIFTATTHQMIQMVYVGSEQREGWDTLLQREADNCSVYEVPRVWLALLVDDWVFEKDASQVLPISDLGIATLVDWRFFHSKRRKNGSRLLFCATLCSMFCAWEHFTFELQHAAWVCTGHPLVSAHKIPTTLEEDLKRARQEPLSRNVSREEGHSQCTPRSYRDWRRLSEEDTDYIAHEYSTTVPRLVLLPSFAISPFGVPFCDACVVILLLNRFLS